MLGEIGMNEMGVIATIALGTTVVGMAAVVVCDVWRRKELKNRGKRRK